MIKIDPVEFENFTMTHVSDDENNFDLVIAISNSKNDNIPLMEIKFESYNSVNQQIDVTKKYAQLTKIKYDYNDIKNQSGVITVWKSIPNFKFLAHSYKGFICVTVAACTVAPK